MWSAALLKYKAWQENVNIWIIDTNFQPSYDRYIFNVAKFFPLQQTY